MAERLPLEVWVLIFKKLPAHKLLGHASCLCRRLHSAAWEAAEVITTRAERDANQISALVSHVRLYDRVGALRRLNIRVGDLPAMVSQQISFLTSLERLEVGMQEGNVYIRNFGFLAPLKRLLSLDVGNTTISASQFAEFLTLTQLTRLFLLKAHISYKEEFRALTRMRSLMSFGAPYTPFDPSYITALPHLFDLVLGWNFVSLPRSSTVTFLSFHRGLTELSLQVFDTREWNLVGVLSSLPLKKLTLSLGAILSELTLAPLEAISALYGIEFRSEMTPSCAEFEAFLRLTQLRQITWEPPEGFPVSVFGRFTRLLALNIGPGEWSGHVRTPEPLPDLPLLTSLAIGHVDSPTLVSSLLRLPRLEKLSCTVDDWPLDARLFPMLDSIREFNLVLASDDLPEEPCGLLQCDAFGSGWVLNSHRELAQLSHRLECAPKKQKKGKERAKRKNW